MEDSSEGHSQENMASVEKSVKRTIKTPAQLNALEMFYNEHKYPSEELKSEFAEQIGLTEKQISSWFCHRRLKDKKRDEASAIGRQDKSSSIVQDRGSGYRQDSCGSTKQGDYRTIEPREVESERLYNCDFAAAELAQNHASRYKGKVSSIRDLSPQNSSSLEENSPSPNENPCAVEYSRYMTQNGGFVPPIATSANGMLYKPSGYLKVRGEIENAAISAVKRQLGRHYREDGPPLGVEFEPLPPGAFESPSRDLAPGPLYGGDIVCRQSPDVSDIRKQSSLGSRYDIRGSKVGSQDSYRDGANGREKCFSDPHIRKSYHKLEQHASYDDYFKSRPSMDEYDDQDGGSSANHGKRKYQSKSDVERIKSVSFPKHHVLDGRKFKSEKMEPQLCNDDSKSPRNDQKFKPSKIMTGSKRTILSEERMPHTAIAEEDYREIKEVDEYIDPAGVALQSRVDFPGKDYVKRLCPPRIPPRTTVSKSSNLKTPSSSSEDEPANTSSGEWGAEN